MKLPEGVKVYVAGREYQGEIPDKLCPAKFKPAKSSKAKK